MDEWLLLTSQQLLKVEGNIAEPLESDAADLPLIISPALTFRKNFSLPTDLDREPGTLRLEIFARFLPGDIDDYLTQFIGVRETETEVETLGLAIEKTKLAAHLDREGPIYFLDRVFAEQYFSESVLFTAKLFAGTYFAFYDEGLRWSRFIPESGDAPRERTREYVAENYTEDYRTKKLPVDGDLETGDGWARLADLIAEHVESDMRLATGGDQETLSVPWSLWIFLVVLLISQCIWWVGARLEQQAYENQMEQKFELILGREPRYPLRELEAALAQHGAQESDRNGGHYKKFPLLARIDAALAQVPVHLLRLSLNNSRIQLIFLTETLKHAEELKSELKNREMQDIEIVSTEAKEIENYRFEVRLKFLPEDGEGKEQE